MKSAPALLLAIVFVGGCATSDGTYPSLLPREIELRSDAEPVATPVVAAPDPALDAKLAEARRALATARGAFDATLQASRPRIVAGAKAAAGSESWLAAQVALGELDSHRAAALDLVQDLEALAVTRAAELAPAYPALDTLRAEAEAELARERAAIAALTT